MSRYARNRSSFAEARDQAAGWTRKSEEHHRKHKPDYLLPVIGLFLIVIGLIVIFAISPGIAIAKNTSESAIISRQLLSAAIGVGAFLVVSRIKTAWWKKALKPLLIASAVVALIVKLFGDTVNGAQRWIQIGGLSFQAAELIKLTLLIWLAVFLAEKYHNKQLADRDKTLKPLAIALGLILVVVAGLESDLGSAGVMIAMIVATVYIVGMPMRNILVIGAAVSVLVFFAIISSGYRRSRITTFLNPTKDCQNAGYQVCESLKAVGSGGMFGKGLGKSVQAYGYLPEASNDSIFAIYAEKFGYFGVMLLLGAYGLLFQRIKRILERTENLYDRLLVVGVMTWLSVQTIVNIGAMIGLLPLKGITLPFISTGGTSLLFVSIALGIIYNISRYTSYRIIKDDSTSEQTGSYPSRPTVVRRNV